MSRPCLLALMLLATPCVARSWNGIEPGVTLDADVTAKFGEPTKRVSASGKQVLVYSGAQAIKGTAQAQFRCDPKNHRVERIDVYPAVVVLEPEIERAYGPQCSGPDTDAEPCYLRRESEGLHTYYLYVRLGLAVFFQDDERTVQSMTFLPPKR